ncbi:MAG: SoxR reducing system RseC family protein [Desulfobacterota bacterium]|nr:SoxR reducing system RseC family protein [Thermodesulfobacteriota bacterium]
MKQAQGRVTSIGEEGTARVRIITDDGLPGCSSKSEHCHHCSEGTSSLVIKVSNRAGAGVNDHVSILFKRGAVLKSVLILLGIPMVGILAGAILGTSLYENSRLSQEGAFMAGSACFGAALVLAFVTYRQFSGDLQPYIDQVIAPKPASQGTIDPVCGMEVDPARAAVKIDYEGKTYFFCNPGCLEAFIREPSRYLVAKREAQRCNPPY